MEPVGDIYPCDSNREAVRRDYTAMLEAAPAIPDELVERVARTLCGQGCKLAQSQNRPCLNADSSNGPCQATKSHLVLSGCMSGARAILTEINKGADDG